MNNYFVHCPRLLSCISVGKKSVDENKFLCGFKFTNRGVKIYRLITWFLFDGKVTHFKFGTKVEKYIVSKNIHILLPQCKTLADVSTFPVKMINFS